MSLISIFQRRKILANVNGTSKSEKFPPPHQDGAVGVTTTASFASSLFESKLNRSRASVDSAPSRGKTQATVSESFWKPTKSSSTGLLMDLRRNIRINRKTKGKEVEVSV